MEKQKKKRRTIKKLLTMKIIPIVILMMLVTVTVVGVVLQQTIYSMVKESHVREAAAYQYDIEGWLDAVIGKVKQTGVAVRNIHFSNDDELLEYLEGTCNLDSSIPNGIYLGDADGRYLDASGWVPPADYVITERDWYKVGIGSEELALSDPYVDADTGGVVVSAAMNTRGTEVISADISMDGLKEKITSYNVMKDGYAFIVDKKTDSFLAIGDDSLTGAVLSDTSSSFYQEISEIIAKDDSIYSGISDISGIRSMKDDAGKEIMVSCSYIEGTSWVLVCVMNKTSLINQVNQVIMGMSIIAVIMIGGFSLLTYLFIARQTKPIGVLSDAIGEIHRGNFTIDIPIRGNDEITTLSENLKEYVENMHQTLAELIRVAENLKKNAEESDRASDAMLEVSGMQADSMEQMGYTMVELTQSTENIAQNAAELASTASALNEDGKNAKGQMDEVVMLTSDGKRDMEEVAVRMKRLDETMSQLNLAVNEVEKTSEEIGKITSTISDIADQTNLLAINASIEAAHAGEAGKGFAVVADEIGKLAMQSADAVENISQMIQRIRGQMQNTVEKTNASVEDMDVSVEIVNRTNEVFANIFENVNRTQKILNDVVEQMQSVDEIAGDMASVTEEQSCGTRKVQESTQELITSAAQIKDASVRINTIAVDLDGAAKNIAENLNKYQI